MTTPEARDQLEAIARADEIARLRDALEGLVATFAMNNAEPVELRDSLRKPIEVASAVLAGKGERLFSEGDALATLSSKDAEIKAALAILLTRYVTPDLVKLVEQAMKDLATANEKICRLRGETEANADLKRFVHYVDHTLNMSPGEVSSIIDFAQGQMARADAKDAEITRLREAMTSVLTRDAQWSRAGKQDARGCNCVNLSRQGEREYESGNCPHQLAWANLSRIEELQEALKPFGDAAENLDDGHSDSGDCWESSAAMSVTAGDFRHARAALTNPEQAGGTE